MIALMCRYRRRFDRDEEGLSLIEVMMSLFILSVAIAAVASVAATSLKSNRLSRDRQEATNLASSVIEATRALTDYDAVGHLTGTAPTNADPFVDGGKFDHDGDGNGEDFVESPVGAVTAHQTTVGHFTVRRFITWYSDPNIVGTQDNKRVTVVVTWNDPAFGPGEVRESTLLAEARRGLPAPAFDVSPDASSETAALDPGDGKRKASFNLALSNLGEQDSYSLTACPNTGTKPPVADACAQTSDVTSVSHFNTYITVLIDGKPWKVSATLAGELMEDNTGDTIPDSKNPIARGVDAPLRIDVEVPSGVDNTAVTMELLFFSAFQTEVDDAIDLCINVGVPTTPCTPTVGPPPAGQTRFFLHHNTTGQRHRVPDRVFDMDTTSPTRVSAINLDHSVDDAESRAGMRMKDGDTAWEIEWDYQNLNTVSQSLSSSFLPELKLWSQSQSCISGASCSPSRVRIEVQLSIVDTSSNPVKITPIATGKVDYTDTTTAWDETSPAVQLQYITGYDPANNALHRIRGISKNKPAGFLRLRLRCHGDSDGDCHVDFDNLVRPSSLTVKFQ